MEGKDDIDYKATVNEFLRHHLRLLIQMIMNSIGKIFHFVSFVLFCFQIIWNIIFSCASAKAEHDLSSLYGVFLCVE